MRERERESLQCQNLLSLLIYMSCPLCPACMELTIMVSGVHVELTVAGAKILDEDLIGGWYNQRISPFTLCVCVCVCLCVCVCVCVFMS